jgi:Cu-processing system permease protein
MTALVARPWWTCGRETLTLAVRSRLLQIFAGVFAALALFVAASGYVLTGGTGLQDFSRTSASLVELVLLIVPLASLVIGVTTLTPDAGTAELLYSQPVARHTVLIGRLIGLFVALVAAEAVGFGAAGAVLFFRTGERGVGAFIAVVAAAAVLTAVFISIAAAIAGGATSQRRARSLAVALGIWLAAVVLFDVAALGLASWLPSGPASRVLMVSAVANPVDAIRTATLFALEGTTAFGAASLAFLRFTSGATGAALWLAASALFWIAAPLAIGIRRLARADI